MAIEVSLGMLAAFSVQLCMTEENIATVSSQ